MSKAKKEVLQRSLSPNTPSCINIDEKKIVHRSTRETTPLPKEIDEVQTPSPARLKKLMHHAARLDKTIPLPSRLRLEKPKENTDTKYAIDHLKSLVVVTLVAHQFIQTITTLDPIDENTIPTSPSFIRTPVDHVHANIARKKSENSLSPKNKSPDSPKQPIYTHHQLKFSNDMTTTEHIKFFPSDAKTSKNMKLGTYRDISKKLEQIKKESHISDTDIAEFIGSIEYGGHTLSRLSIEDIKYLVNVSSLLFSTESSRHPSSYIIHKMFIDLVKAGIYSFNEMGAILPMALPGAVKATITIEKFYLLKC